MFSFQHKILINVINWAKGPNRLSDVRNQQQKMRKNIRIIYNTYFRYMSTHDKLLWIMISTIFYCYEVFAIMTRAEKDKQKMKKRKNE